ncbi:MAG TPA: DUF455 family protein [Verrucomicrobiae bacterium]|jgi:uncharacterized ferritin-like protein (DUF455 family)
MELRELAEQVLFATTLEEKLQCPANITDERPGAALVTPSTPGRPTELGFKPRGASQAEFPGVHRLEDERERGRLLHFFANHELLATELMALVLLKFPDAPAAFRRGVLQTLKDEQEHTRLYLQRMKECGIQFGELPVSGYFWRAISGMESPMDFVAGLSLTFEQANLDFAQHFARGFAKAGDAATAQLLDRIHRDEIAHVAHGLKWFRRWKNPDESDWAAFCRQLKFPLSPQRAKGLALNIEGRRAAGLDAIFIDELNVYSQSKGRTPSVFVFNPFAEARIAQGKSFTPGKHQAQLARDLANLPQYLCRQDDIVLVESRPSIEFLSGIKLAGFPLPEFVEPKKIQSLTQRKLGGLRPWAWGPDSIELFAPLFPNLTSRSRSANECFTGEIAQLYSKGWSAALLRKFLRAQGGAGCPQPAVRRGEDTAPYLEVRERLCTEHEVGVPVHTLADALDAIAVIRARGHHKVVVKEALGLAGHNAIRLWEPDISKAQRRWMENATDSGRQLVVEPWLERVQDFSVQLEMTEQGLQLRGYTGLINDRRGQFQANYAAPNYDRRIPAEVTKCFRKPADIVARLHNLYEQIFLLLEVELRRARFFGPVGIDAFVYHTAQGECRLKPIVEINPRFTMGRLTVELMKHTAPGSHGMFRLVSRAAVRAAGFENFSAYARSLSEEIPLHLEGEPVRRIREGMLFLNEPARAEACLAIFQISRDGNFHNALSGVASAV